MISRILRHNRVAGAVVIVSLLAMVAFKTSYQFPATSAQVVSPKSAQALEEISKGIAEITMNTSKALVLISVSKVSQNLRGYSDPFDPFGFGGLPQMPQPKQEGLGSGFFVDVDKGYIITNNHVIEGADEISVKLANGESLAAKVIGRDPNTDVAVVQLSDLKFKREGLGALAFGDSDALTPGTLVVALGSPFGLDASASLGIVSAVGRGPMQLTPLGNFIQTDTAINPGNSGGPMVLAYNGKVIGMNTAIFSRSGGSQGIGFAVPINLVRDVALSLITEGRVTRGYIGVQFRPLLPEWTESLNLPKGTTGAVVVQIAPHGPAEKSGIKANDVITELDGKAIKSIEELVNIVGLAKPGAKIALMLYREGKKLSINVAIGDWPGSNEVASEPASDEAKDTNGYGLEMSLVKYEERWALKIEQVASKSSAARAGMQPGDLILGINGYNHNKELMEKFRKGELKDTILLLVEREYGDRRSGVKGRERFLISLRSSN